MRRSMAVIMVSLTVLMTLTWPDESPARAGRGGSVGSRGSRSYSDASRPAPVNPNPFAPARRDEVRHAPPATPTGWPGGTGWFLTGGLLGGLLFGGRGAGMGLLDVVALAALAYVALRLLRPRAEGPAFASGHGGAGAIFAGVAERAPDRDADAGNGRVDRAFDRVEFAGTAALMFEKVQHAWAARDLRPVAAMLTPEMQANFQRECDQMAARGRLSRIEDVSVEAAEVVDTWQDKGHDWATVRMDAQMVDYTVDEKTGQVLDGDASAPTVVEEVWTFSRPVWAKGWRLSAIQQPVRAPSRL